MAARHWPFYTYGLLVYKGWPTLVSLSWSRGKYDTRFLILKNISWHFIKPMHVDTASPEEVEEP
jgi:hypothetical protein